MNQTLRPFEGYANLIPDYKDFVDSMHGEAPISFRVNTLLTDSSKLIHSLRRRHIDIRPTPPGDPFWFAENLSHPGHLIEHMMGLIYTQAVSSGLPSLVLRPEPEEAVLDLCAAPGSKTTQMAQQMKNRGLIIANEPYRDRHSSLQSNIRRLGVTNAVVTAYSGQNFPLRWRFSKVLVDAPCSGEGNARIGLDGTLVGFRPAHRDLSRIQKGILLRGFDVLTEDGVLVYSTCTYNPLENEAVLSHLLNERPARLISINLHIPHDPGITQWNGNAYHEDLVKAWRIYPHRLHSVGFFLAKIGRR